MTISALILMGLLLIFLFYILYRQNRKPKGTRYLYSLAKRWVLYGYSVILILATVLFFILPLEMAKDPEIDDEKSIEKVLQDVQNLYDYAMEGRPEEAEGIKVLKEWSFQYEGDLLEILAPNHLDSSIFMVIERIPATNTIEAVYYSSKGTWDDFDLITSKIPVPDIAIEGDKLVISALETQRIELYKFTNDFVIGQFLGEGGWEFQKLLGYMAGRQLLYIRVPEGLQLHNKIPAAYYVE